MPGPPAPFVPTPLPNIGNSHDRLADATTTVKFEGKKVAIKGTYYMSRLSGDMVSKGTGGGILSATTEGKTKFVAPGSMNVKAEGENIQLLGDAMTGNGNTDNTANPAGNIQPAKGKGGLVEAVGQEIADELCTAACDAQKKKDEGTGSYHRQTDMRNNIDPAATRGTNTVGGNTGVLGEVGQAIQPGGLGAFVGKWGTAVAKAGCKVKWDIVLTTATSTAKGTLKWADVKKIIEVKFKGDSPTPAQENAKAAMGKEAKEKFYEMDVEKDCTCP